MLNGMASDNITYEKAIGNSDEILIQELLKIYTTIFEDADIDFFKDRFYENPKITSVLAYCKQELIGFKIGYPYSRDIFYSWVGGVLPNYRQLGIANKLAEQQEISAKTQGFKKMRTKSMNQYKPMMILNLKRRFDLIDIYTNAKGQTKIIFEKNL